MENFETIKKTMEEIRPLLIKAIHDQMIKEYIDEYKTDHNGEEPTKELINECSMILITMKQPAFEADAFIQEFINKIETIIKKEKRKKKLCIIGVNTIVLAMVLNLAFVFVAEYINKTFNVDILNGYEPFSFSNAVNAVIIILVMIVFYIVSIVKKE